MRDKALTITGGDVRNAQRLDSPNNTLWRITLEPSVTGRIRLPATKICDAKGATCAADDRKLSTELDFTVPRQYPLGSNPLSLQTGAVASGFESGQG